MLEPHDRSSGSVMLSSTEAVGSQRTAPGASVQAIIMSCQASPVAERKSTSTAWKNDWKLLLRVMAVFESITILPNIWAMAGWGGGGRHNRDIENKFGFVLRY